MQQIARAFEPAHGQILIRRKSHYVIFMHGNAPLTARLLTPVMVDAINGRLVDSRSLPWYVSTVLLSQPLHFGDYGGLPLKIVWAVMDIAAIAILVSGIYLWVARRGRRGAPQDSRNGETRHRIDLRKAYRAPLWLAAVSLLGLIVALVGDGVWNLIGWLCVAAPIVVAAGKLRKISASDRR